jgi:hypothetical protein
MFMFTLGRTILVIESFPLIKFRTTLNVPLKSINDD